MKLKIQIHNWLSKFVFDNIVAKLIGIIIAWTIALIPVWFYIFARWLIEPVGFWQELSIVVVSLLTLGWLQAILIILVVGVTISILSD